MKKTSSSGVIKKNLRRVWRTFFFVAAVICALQVLPWKESALVLPALSPFVIVCGSIATRNATILAVLALPVFLLAFFRGRWFCVYLCPVGFATEMAGNLNSRKATAYRKFPHFGRWLVLLGLGGALAGYPFFIWLDPLSLFNGFFSIWHLPLTLAGALPALGFVLVLILSIFRPHAWCRRLCPLGAIQEMISFLGRKALRNRHRHASTSWKKRAEPAFGRRTFLGILGGGLAGLIMRHIPGHAKLQPIRPPGAVPEDLITGLCVRCGNCERACPAGIIHPDLGQSGVAGLLTPVLDYSESYCYEWCRECTLVCPTGAIQRLSLEEKARTAIGLAEITRSRCIAWNGGAHCMVCREICPYQAIEIVQHNGVKCPVVNPDKCRGCGICHNQCPARPQKAINIRGVVQKKL